MSFAAYYKLSSYILIAAGFLALAATGALSPVMFSLFGGVLAASWFVDTAKIRRALPSTIWWTVGILCLPMFYFDYRWFSRSILLSLLHLMLWTAALKLLTRNTDRDYVHLYLLSLVALLAAAALTVHLMFLLCLILYLGAGISTLILFEMNHSSTRALLGGMIRPVFVPRNLRGTGFELFAGFPSKSMAAHAMALTAIILACAVPLFFLLPRISLGVHYRAVSQPEMISGFSDRVELGTLGRIKTSDRLVMKVKVDAPGFHLPEDLKWRGIALDYFDGKTWSRSRSDRRRIPTQAGFYKLEQAAQGTDILMQTILLQPMATDIVFGSHKVLAVSGDLGRLERDESDNIYSLAQRAGASRYAIVSDISRPVPKLMAPYPDPLPSEIATYCLQVPQLDGRIAALAHSLTSRAPTPFEKALALEGYLRKAYGYSLDLQGDSSQPDPLAIFLFDIRRGHCEYFASAMTIMLRQLHIPARLVNGFRTGTPNRLSGHWTVRQRDAHSWVEAWFPPYGWVEFDPTPAESGSRAQVVGSAFADLWDAFDFWWTDEIVNYDIRKQSRLIQAGRFSWQGMQESALEFMQNAGLILNTRLIHLRPSRWIHSLPVILTGLFGILLLTFALLCRRRPARMRRILRTLRGSHGKVERCTAIAAFYEEALEVLHRRGWKRGKDQTPREFALAHASEPFGHVLAALTEIYQRVRFGQITEEGDMACVHELLRSLRQ
jgi:protein-glutamine gamma-glutamyltransferase